MLTFYPSPCHPRLNHPACLWPAIPYFLNDTDQPRVIRTHCLCYLLRLLLSHPSTHLLVIPLCLLPLAFQQSLLLDDLLPNAHGSRSWEGRLFLEDDTLCHWHVGLSFTVFEQGDAFLGYCVNCCWLLLFNDLRVFTLPKKEIWTRVQLFRPHSQCIKTLGCWFVARILSIDFLWKFSNNFTIFEILLIALRKLAVNE